jgi:hypothetical protein
MNNNVIVVAGSAPDQAVARGVTDAISSPPSGRVADSDQVLTQLQSRIDQSQVQSATVEGQSGLTVVGAVFLRKANHSHHRAVRIPTQIGTYPAGRLF